MKELTGFAMNVLGRQAEDGRLVPVAEVILIATEPQYRLTIDGMVRDRLAETVRVVADVKQLRRLSDALGEYANELEAIADGKGEGVQ